jgi:tyrosine-protein phosphatase YwqE
MSFFSSLFSKKSQLPPFDLSLIKADMHSHLIPGIDDGSRSMDETIAILAKFESLGYKKIITTPHIMNEVYPNTPEIILEGLEHVKQTAQGLGISLEIEAAAEYYFDDSLVEKIKDRSVLTFGDRFVLVEFSFHTAPAYESTLFFEMQMANYKPVLAHFERYSYYHGSIDKAIEYREKGVNIQVNLNSLTGHYGPEVRKQAQRLIDNKLVDFVGSDCHRIQHQLLLEEHLADPYFHKLATLDLKNLTL